MGRGEEVWGWKEGMGPLTSPQSIRAPFSTCFDFILPQFLQNVQFYTLIHSFNEYNFMHITTLYVTTLDHVTTIYS